MKKFPRVPYAGIRWLVGQKHVGTPNEEIAEEFVRRMKKAGADEDEIAEAISYAVAVHRANLALYLAVDRGGDAAMQRKLERALAKKDGYGRLLSNFKV